MEQRALVRRRGCDTDARGTVVQLSEAGMAAVRTAAPGHVDTVRHVLLDALSNDELSTLRAISERVSSRTNDEYPQADCASEPAPDEEPDFAPPPC